MNKKAARKSLQKAKKASAFLRPLKKLLVFCLFFLLLACQAKNAPTPSNGVLPRTDPSYLAWLEQQSMLANSRSFAAQVSESGRAFASQGGPERVKVLLAAAPNWLWIDPTEMGGGRPVFRQLANEGFPAMLAKNGLEGLFIAPVGESGGIWSEGMNSGWDVASFSFSAAAGSNEDYARLCDLAEKAGIQLGGELPPAATGIGPDFMLQARNAPRHGGLYAMIPVPVDQWKLLPDVAREWDGRKIDAQTLARLADVLPENFARDMAHWTSPGGWAATGEIMGSDGQVRRWLYRYAQTPARPVLLWQDPSGLAKKIFSAAIIKQTGLEGQTLTGIRPEPLFGLEAGDKDSLEPGMEALGALAREIHRYGGWAMQNDSVPPRIMQQVLAGPVDFCADSLLEEAAIKAISSGNPARLWEILREDRKIGISFRRTARGVLAEDSLRPVPLRVFQALKKNAGAEDPEQFADAWLVGLAMRIGLPGLAMFTPWDIGLDWPVNAPGIPAQLYGSPGVREEILALLASRKKAKLAEGEIAGLYGGQDGWLGVASKLPDGGYWLCLVNFINREKEISLALPGKAIRAVDAASGTEIDCLEGQKARLVLDGRKARHVVFCRK